jgi:hypothetical protein
MRRRAWDDLRTFFVFHASLSARADQSFIGIGMKSIDTTTLGNAAKRARYEIVWRLIRRGRDGEPVFFAQERGSIEDPGRPEPKRSVISG